MCGTKLDAVIETAASVPDSSGMNTEAPAPKMSVLRTVGGALSDIGRKALDKLSASASKSDLQPALPAADTDAAQPDSAAVPGNADGVSAASETAEAQAAAVTAARRSPSGRWKASLLPKGSRILQSLSFGSTPSPNAAQNDGTEKHAVIDSRSEHQRGMEKFLNTFVAILAGAAALALGIYIVFKKLSSSACSLLSGGK